MHARTYRCWNLSLRERQASTYSSMLVRLNAFSRCSTHVAYCLTMSQCAIQRALLRVHACKYTSAMRCYMLEYYASDT